MIAAPAETSPPPDAAPAGAGEIVIDPNGLYTRERLMQLFEVSDKTIRRWVDEGTLPAGFKLGGTECWRGNALLKWFDNKQNAAVDEWRSINGGRRRG